MSLPAEKPAPSQNAAFVIEEEVDLPKLAAALISLEVYCRRHQLGEVAGRLDDAIDVLDRLMTR